MPKKTIVTKTTISRHPKSPMKPSLPPPGAEAIQGPDPSPNLVDDEYTITAPLPQYKEQQHIPSMFPVSARVVHEGEDYEDLQEQLQRQGEELQRVIAGLANAPVAQVVANEEAIQANGAHIADGNDEEAQIARGHGNKAHVTHSIEKQDGFSDTESSDEASAKSMTRSSRLCGMKRKWILVAASILVLVIACVALGVALSQKNTPKIDATDDSSPTAQCRRNDNGDRVCIQENFPAPGFRTAFANCPSDATSVTECGSCGIAPPGYQSGGSLCTSCSVCSNTVAYDCANVATGTCTRHDCSGNCA